MDSIATPKPVPIVTPEFDQRKVPHQYLEKWKIYLLTIEVIVFFTGIIIVLAMDYPFSFDITDLSKINRLITYGRILQAIGGLLFSVTLINIALQDRMVESNIRSSMLIIAGLVMAIEIMFI